MNQPEALTLSVDDPRYVVGRDGDVSVFADLCRQNRLVFLVGESGVGKTALVRSKLIPALDRDAGLWPVAIDGWGEDWSDGPAGRLMATVRKLHDGLGDDRSKVKLGEGAQLAGHLEALVEMGTMRRRTPLLIFDQFDDYQLRHRGRFRNNVGVWKTPKQVGKDNEFWRRIGELIRGGQARALIVTSDKSSDGLDSVKFVLSAPKRPLDRPRSGEVRPLLIRLTSEAGVIADPDAGWGRLRDRLERDLEEGGGFLPIRLRMALEGLKTAKMTQDLSERSYLRLGGLTGLETAAVASAADAAARESGIDAVDIFRVLDAMVDREHEKTASRTLEELAGACRSATDRAKLSEALATLGRLRIVRPILDRDDRWQLDHDYLWRGVAAVQRADGANAQLRDAHRRWTYSAGWARRWWGRLLPTWLQARLFLGRLTGRVRYGNARGFALRSLLVSTLVYLLLGAAAWLAYWSYSERTGWYEARLLFAAMKVSGPIDDQENDRCWSPLVAESRPGVRRKFLWLCLDARNAYGRLYVRLNQSFWSEPSASPYAYTYPIHGEAPRVLEAIIGSAPEVRAWTWNTLVDRITTTEDAGLVLAIYALAMQEPPGSGHTQFDPRACEAILGLIDRSRAEEWKGNLTHDNQLIGALDRLVRLLPQPQQAKVALRIAETIAKAAKDDRQTGPLPSHVFIGLLESLRGLPELDPAPLKRRVAPALASAIIRDKKKADSSPGASLMNYQINTNFSWYAYFIDGSTAGEASGVGEAVSDALIAAFNHLPKSDRFGPDPFYRGLTISYALLLNRCEEGRAGELAQKFLRGLRDSLDRKENARKVNTLAFFVARSARHLPDDELMTLIQSLKIAEPSAAAPELALTHAILLSALPMRRRAWAEAPLAKVVDAMIREVATGDQGDRPPAARDARSIFRTEYFASLPADAGLDRLAREIADEKEPARLGRLLIFYTQIDPYHRETCHDEVAAKLPEFILAGGDIGLYTLFAESLAWFAPQLQGDRALALADAIADRYLNDPERKPGLLLAYAALKERSQGERGRRMAEALAECEREQRVFGRNLWDF